MHLRLALNLKQFLLDLGALCALRLGPNFYEIHPWLETIQSYFIAGPELISTATSAYICKLQTYHLVFDIANVAATFEPFLTSPIGNLSDKKTSQN
jgi:hypothetical protein